MSWFYSLCCVFPIMSSFWPKFIGLEWHLLCYLQKGWRSISWLDCSSILVAIAWCSFHLWERPACWMCLPPSPRECCLHIDMQYSMDHTLRGPNASGYACWVSSSSFPNFLEEGECAPSERGWATMLLFWLSPCSLCVLRNVGWPLWTSPSSYVKWKPRYWAHCWRWRITEMIHLNMSSWHHQGPDALHPVRQPKHLISCISLSLVQRWKEAQAL